MSIEDKQLLLDFYINSNLFQVETIWYLLYNLI